MFGNFFVRIRAEIFVKKSVESCQNFFSRVRDFVSVIFRRDVISFDKRGNSAAVKIFPIDFQIVESRHQRRFGTFAAQNNFLVNIFSDVRKNQIIKLKLPFRQKFFDTFGSAFFFRQKNFFAVRKFYQTRSLVVVQSHALKKLLGNDTSFCRGKIQIFKSKLLHDSGSKFFFENNFAVNLFVRNEFQKHCTKSADFNAAINFARKILADFVTDKFVDNLPRLKRFDKIFVNRSREVLNVFNFFLREFVKKNSALRLRIHAKKFTALFRQKFSRTVRTCRKKNSPRIQRFFFNLFHERSFSANFYIFRRKIIFRVDAQTTFRQVF